MGDLAIRGPIARDDLAGLCNRVCALLREHGPGTADCDVAGIAPDAVTVDALARLQLAAGRLGCQVHLTNASRDLCELVAFMGLADVLAGVGEDDVVTTMHEGELELDEELVRRLLVEQFPHWGALPLARVEPGGTVHAIFRLGEELAVRLPRHEGPTEPDTRAARWLPLLAPRLPLAIPVPVAQGRPSAGYPWHWEIHRWVEGETVPVAAIGATQAARDLAAFVAALQAVEPDGAPQGRGVPLTERDESFRHWLARFRGDPAVAAVWAEALVAPAWHGPPVWHHGDLDARNWLVRAGRIAGVIDWGCMGVGDPACDVMVAWKLGSAAARDAFREALPTDEATWCRARGWVVSQAVAILAYYTPENNPVLYREAESWLALVLTERG